MKKVCSNYYFSCQYFFLKRIVLGTILSGLPFGLLGQHILSFSDSIAYTHQDTVQLSQKFILPHTVVIKKLERASITHAFKEGSTVPESFFKVIGISGQIEFINIIDPGTYLFQYKYTNSPPSSIVGFVPMSESMLKDSLPESPYFTPSELALNVKNNSGTPAFWETSQIRKNGSLSRGLVVGNNRSASVTSGLRLQLEGDLGDGLSILGNITDENIPIQPDGTTQQISDFDKIFIQLQKDPFQVTLGDYEIKKQNSRFANFYRNVQGLNAVYHQNSIKAFVSGAVAKGRFQTNTFEGLEGVSGPYRLTGQNGERFIFVLAGSERIYLNGKLMIRGATQDYIIDYNTAEITFTPKHVITSVSRIVVDFEYNDRQYNRSLLIAGFAYEQPNQKVSINASYARDADNPNAPFEDPEVFSSIRDSLSTIGDNVEEAAISGISLSGFNGDEVRYAQRDTVIRDSAFIFYEFSTHPEEAVFKIFFSFVGSGNGDYVRDVSGINNNVFRWVSPDESGFSRGDYAPIRTWVLPKLLEVVDIQSNIQLNDHISIYTETGISREDKNRLSPIDDEDNTGLANLTGLRFSNVKLWDSTTLSFDLNHQYVAARYENLDRIYRPEYDRVWNLLSLSERENEHISTGKLTLNFDQLSVGSEVGIRQTASGSKALRQKYSVESRAKKWLEGNYTFTQITNQDDAILRDATWTRHEGDIFKRLGNWRIGTQIWLEDRLEQRADSTTDRTISFADLTPYIKTSGERKLSLELSWNYRKEKAFLAGKDRDKSLAHTYTLQTAYRPSPKLQLKGVTSLRDFRILDTLFQQQGLSNTRLVQSQLQAQFQSSWIRTQWVYEVNSEQVSRREWRFIEVNPGQGQFEWQDVNNNGIQDIDEFQLAVNPLAANFIRVQIPSRELFPTTRLSLKGNLNIDLRKLIPSSESSSFFHKLLSQIRSVSAVNLRQNKNRASAFNTYLLQLKNIFEDENLLDAQYSFRQDLTFFPNSPGGDLRLSYHDNQSKLFLSTGNELRGIKFGTLKPRVNFDAKRSIEVEAQIGRKFAEADSFNSRNFNIQFIDVQPQFNIQLNRKLRLALGYQYSFKKNLDESTQNSTTAFTHKTFLDAKLNMKDRNNIFTKFELVHINQIGEADFSAAYELREGLQNGFNGIWQAFITFYILSNVELSINYDGRVSTEEAVIHTARMQVRAFF